MVIVCYLGGTCGDLITALIDPRHVCLDGTTVRHHENRTRLKKPHLFSSDQDKDLYIQSVDYDSISSHDLDYHAKKKHDFLSITVHDSEVALWAAQRFKALHRPLVWQEMQAKCGAKDEQDYAQMMKDYSNMVSILSNKCLRLEDILAGRAIVSLSEKFGINCPPDSEFFYQSWLAVQDR